MKNGILRCVTLLTMLALSSWAYAATAPAEVSYEKNVRPIFHDYCLNCHEL